MSKICLFFILSLYLPYGENLYWQSRLRYSKTPGLVSDQTVSLRVYIFLGTECPLSQSYTLPLKQLQLKYGGKSVEFIGVFPAKDDNDEKIKTFADTYDVRFRFVRDIGYHLTQRYKATVTPQAVLVNKADEMLYSGKIDDWVVSLGKKKKTPTKHYLDEAIQAGVAGLEVRVKQTTPIGCLIEFAPASSHQH